MWMMPLHLHVNQKSDYDDDDKLYVGIVKQAGDMKCPECGLVVGDS